VKALRLAALMAIPLLLAGCTTRERLNPLDPMNRVTHGALTGFDAIAGESVVEFRWPQLASTGITGYRVQRWRPGEAPQWLGGADDPPTATAGEDFAVANDSTYVYRLVAHLSGGDSALSAPDTATPGVRRLLTLEAGIPAFSRLSPDARDLLFEREEVEAYEDMELDTRHQVVWLPIEGLDVIVRRDLSGATVGPDLVLPGPVDVSVSNARGIGWVASPTGQRVVSFGPDLADPSPQITINAIGHPRAVEAGTVDLSVWIGNDEGSVYRVRAQDGAQTDQWNLGAGGVREIALDEPAGAAWIATRPGTTDELYYLVHADSTRRLVLSRLANVVDLAVDAASGDLWISERGEPGLGAGRLTRVSRDGVTLATLPAIEPYGIDVDPIDGSVWVSDLRSDRILHVDKNGATTRRSPPLSAPYAVRVHVP